MSTPERGVGAAPRRPYRNVSTATSLPQRLYRDAPTATPLPRRLYRDVSTATSLPRRPYRNAPTATPLPQRLYRDAPVGAAAAANPSFVRPPVEVQDEQQDRSQHGTHAERDRDVGAVKSSP